MKAFHLISVIDESNIDALIKFKAADFLLCTSLDLKLIFVDRTLPLLESYFRELFIGLDAHS